MKATRIIFLLSLVGISLFVFFAPFSNTKNDAIVKEVNLYSSRKENLTKDLFNQFTINTGIKVNFIIDKAPKLIAKLQHEGKNTPADLFLTSDIGNLAKAKQKGLLAPVNSEILNKNIPAALRDSENHWFGLSRRVRAIFYNKEKLNGSEISDYEDLADSKWQGKILIRSSGNIYNQSLLASIIKANGLEKARKWTKGLVDNFARKPQGGDTDQLRALAASEGELAIANSYYYGRLLASSKTKDNEVANKIGIIFPNQKNRGAHINISGGGLTKHAKNIKNAQLLLEFLSSDTAQEIYAKRNHEYPIRDNIVLSEVVSKWDKFKADEENLLGFAKYLPQALKIADEENWR